MHLHPRVKTFHRWLRRGFVLWAIVSTAWLANSVRTQGVDPAVLRNSADVQVIDTRQTLQFSPQLSERRPALLFICGSGIAAEAYAPLLRPIAEAGYRVCIVRLPWRFAPRDEDKQAAVDRACQLIADQSVADGWVVAGHSLGAALACRVAQAKPDALKGLVLIATTHPKRDDLSSLEVPTTKVVGSLDGIARLADVQRNAWRLPADTRWVEIAGANHSQFGHYGRQLFDGRPQISRTEQQRLTRSALLEALQAAEQSAAERAADKPAASPPVSDTAVGSGGDLPESR